MYRELARRGASGVFLNNVYAKTSRFRDSFFVRISNLWNALPSDLKSESNVNVFKNKLKAFYFTRLRVVFDADDARTFKLVCRKSRRINKLDVFVDFFFLEITSVWGLV